MFKNNRPRDGQFSHNAEAVQICEPKIFNILWHLARDADHCFQEENRGWIIGKYVWMIIMR
jgi:hypothetical protein